MINHVNLSVVLLRAPYLLLLKLLLSWLHISLNIYLCGIDCVINVIATVIKLARVIILSGDSIFNLGRAVNILWIKEPLEQWFIIWEQIVLIVIVLNTYKLYFSKWRSSVMAQDLRAWLGRINDSLSFILTLPALHHDVSIAVYCLFHIIKFLIEFQFVGRQAAVVWRGIVLRV
jgi:hypothetical protein